MNGFLADLRYGARQLMRAPGFTVVAVLTLALGIGANTTVFSLLNAALFRQVDAPQPSRLVWLVGTSDDRSRFRSLSFPEYREHAARDSVFSGLMTYQDVPLSLGSGGEPERVTGLLVTGNYFAVLGIRPALGRVFLPDEDRTLGTHPVAVLGYNLWSRRFGADSTILGRAIVLNGRSFSVIGVAPKGFFGIDLGQQGDVWLPMAMIGQAWPGNANLLDARNYTWLRAVGRLRPGVSMDQARLAAGATGQALAREWPETLEHTSASIEPLAGGLDPNNRNEAFPVFMLLMAVPGMVLLIACSNAANLLLARASGRQREIGVRLALGASRGRLIRMLVAESLLLGTAAGLLGMLTSYWLTSIVSALGQVPAEVNNVIEPDGRVLAFTMTLGILTGLVFGLAPAIGATRPALVPALKGEGIAGGRFRRSRLVNLFVAAQVSASLVLLVVAGLLLRTLAKATRVDIGFSPQHGAVASFDLIVQGYDRPRRDVFYQELLQRVRALPGVTAASLTSEMPLSGRMTGAAVLTEGEDPGPGAAPSNARPRNGRQVYLSTVFPAFFHTLGVALIAGRDFTDRDDASAPGVVIVNETLAAQLWPGQSPLGKRLRFTGPNERLLEVVGVAHDGKYDDLTERPQAYLYLPRAQQMRFAADMTLLLRTAGDAGPILPVLRSVIREMDRNLPIYHVRTLEEHVRLRLDKQRGASALLGAFGALALILATLGLYGVMAYAVAQRTREIGIRIALGATQHGVLGMVVGEGMKMAAAGIVIGLALSAALTRFIARFLYGVTATDLATFVAVAALLTAVAAAASFIPARRATRVDPVVALRSE